MKPSHTHHDDPFPPAAGEPADLCQRLRADLDLHADAAILHVYGEVDAYTQPRWRRILDTAIAEAAATSGHLVVDAGPIQFIGCRPILDLADRAQKSLACGVQVSVLNPSPGVVDRVITIAGLTVWLPVHSTLAEALSTRRQAATPAHVAVPVRGS
ncbi:STAS domain-containing protein [Nocardia salmonicida]|uniref:STAS domain-containing protein n=1 Tax=Nocardia salmonicida TaxID=53431 RepID=UPI0037B39044